MCWPGLSCSSSALRGVAIAPPRSLLEVGFVQSPGLQHIKIEDGPGRRLGRSFRIKLWPTLVFLRDGVELARVVRPTSVAAIGEALARVSD